MTERVVIACLEKMFLKKYSPNDSKKVGEVMMQEWIKIFLTGFVSFAVSLSVALILRCKDRKEATEIRKDDLEKAVKKREEDREWISKQFAESQEQTTALKNLSESSKQNIEILLQEKARDLKSLLQLEADFEPFKSKTHGTITKIHGNIALHITNLVARDITIKSIMIPESSPFEFIEEEISEYCAMYLLDASGNFMTIKRTTAKQIVLCSKNIFSSAELTSDANVGSKVVIVPANKHMSVNLLVFCPENQAKNIANFTLEYTTSDNPYKFYTDHFKILSSHSK